MPPDPWTDHERAIIKPIGMRHTWVHDNFQKMKVKNDPQVRVHYGFKSWKTLVQEFHKAGGSVLKKEGNIKHYWRDTFFDPKTPDEKIDLWNQYRDDKIVRGIVTRHDAIDSPLDDEEGEDNNDSVEEDEEPDDEEDQGNHDSAEEDNGKYEEYVEQSEDEVMQGGFDNVDHFAQWLANGDHFEDVVAMFDEAHESPHNQALLRPDLEPDGLPSPRVGWQEIDMIYEGITSLQLGLETLTNSLTTLRQQMDMINLPRQQLSVTFQQNHKHRDFRP